MYARARDAGGALDHQQVESLALAQLEVANIRGARDELSVLSARATHPEYGVLVRPGMNRVLRAVVESELARHDNDPLQSIALIQDFLNDASIPIDEQTQAWLMMRGAELQLVQGQAQEVIDQLLVLMRRTESWAGGVPKEILAEMSMILGEAYGVTGEPDRARHHLGAAREQADRGSLLRGRVLVDLGDLALSEGKVGTAIEMFDEVILDYPLTESRADALLGRAAALSIQGEHQSSLQDYQEACGAIESISSQDEQRLERITAALADRHDASIVQRDLTLALDYIILAEGFFPSDEPPVSVLERIASTSRQLADDLSLQEDVAISSEAHRLYRQSGDTHLRVA